MCQQDPRNLKAATLDNQPIQKSTTTYTQTVVQRSGLQVAPHNNQPIQQFPTMNTPLFSVLIANYNNGRYLMDAIESVRCQTYTHWEIVIVDDGSTDNSKTVYEGLKNDSRIRIFHNDENKGCGYTKRRCAELAKGEICGFVDADDCITPDAIEIMTNAHIQKPQCSLIYSTFYNTDNNLNVISISNHQCVIPNNESFLTFNVPGAISHLATFKKDRYNQTQGINQLMLKAVDVDLYLKLEEKGELFFIPQPLYYYRTETGNNISLGKDNSIKATYWDFIARLNAYQRRHLPIESITYSTLSSLYKEAFSDGQDDIRNTCSYRTGKRIITPFRFLARKIK